MIKTKYIGYLKNKYPDEIYGTSLLKITDYSSVFNKPSSGNYSYFPFNLYILFEIRGNLNSNLVVCKFPEEYFSVCLKNLNQILCKIASVVCRNLIKAEIHIVKLRKIDVLSSRISLFYYVPLLKNTYEIEGVNLPHFTYFDEFNNIVYSSPLLSQLIDADLSNGRDELIKTSFKTFIKNSLDDELQFLNEPN